MFDGVEVRSEGNIEDQLDWRILAAAEVGDVVGLVDLAVVQEYRELPLPVVHLQLQEGLHEGVAVDRLLSGAVFNDALGLGQEGAARNCLLLVEILLELDGIVLGGPEGILLVAVWR